MKYELIKEYPGSPKLGAEVETTMSNSVMHEGRWLYEVGKSDEFWKKVEPKVLFTSEDGKEIFEEQEAFYITNDDKHDAFDIKDKKFERSFDMDKHKGYKFFSTKDAAAEYVLFNKPTFSINDLCGNVLSEDCELKKKLLRIAENKLNGKTEPGTITTTAVATV
jgi:hypothetical protein